MADEIQRAAILRGTAALETMMSMIGNVDKNDHHLASVFVENELDIRDAIQAAIRGCLPGDDE